MKKYFAVEDTCSGKEMLYQVVCGDTEDGFDIVAVGHNIGALADSLIRHVKNNGGQSLDIYIKPPAEGYWIDIKQEAGSKEEISEDEVEVHQTNEINKGKMNQLMKRLHIKTVNEDFMFMFYR